MKLFDLDSPLMQGLNKAADLLWLNILTMVCALPIVTAGASFTAMHYMALKLVRNEETYVTRGFFKSFRENFRQATLIWLLLLAAMGVMAGDYYIIKYSGLKFPAALQVVIVAAGLLVMFTALYVFPVLAKFDNTVGKTIKNAFMMSILQLPKTILMVICYCLPVILYLVSVRLVPVIILFGFSVPAFLCALLYNKFFQKLEDQISQEARERGEPMPEDEDEHIFSDKPLE